MGACGYYLYMQEAGLAFGVEVVLDDTKFECFMI